MEDYPHEWSEKSLFHEKDSRLSPRIIRLLNVFLNGQVPILKIWVETSVFTIHRCSLKLHV